MFDPSIRMVCVVLIHRCQNSHMAAYVWYGSVIPIQLFHVSRRARRGCAHRHGSSHIDVRAAAVWVEVGK